jgi:hypothetical protein
LVDQAWAEPYLPTSTHLHHNKPPNIMTTAILIAGKVKYAARSPKDFGHGEHINIVITPLTGSKDIKVWGNPDDAIASLTKGQQVTLLFDGRTYKLIADSQPAQVKQPVATELSADQKRAADRHSTSLIAIYVEEQANLLKFCWVTASEKLDSLVKIRKGRKSGKPIKLARMNVAAKAVRLLFKQLLLTLYED